MKPKQVRQGDVLLDPTTLPTGAKLVRRGRLVLALGEATGHAHEVLDGIMYEKNGRFYLRVDTPTELAHTTSRQGRQLSDDHAPIALAPGTYEVVQQEEKLGDLWRTVSD